MAQKKTMNQYYFSVEGKTELWYLQWLQKTINATEAAICRVSFICNDTPPLSYIKSELVPKKAVIYHWWDYESDGHTGGFNKAMDDMKAAESTDKKVVYKLGYTNFAFELWIILHKADCQHRIANRKEYVKPINNAYDKAFENLDKYKKETNFKQLLTQLQISDVKDAIARAKTIMARNKTSGYTLEQRHKYTYYKENPSLALWESIERILKECEL